MMPTDPGKNAIGTNTAINTRVIPTMAPVICDIALCVACFGASPSSAMVRSTFSTTTMASSTRMPTASTIPNMVSMLMENPASISVAQVPNNATGTTMVGMIVYRMFCRNRNITTKTRTTASTNVEMTFLIEAFTTGVMLYGISYAMFAGKKRESSFILASTALAVASALPVGDSSTERPAVGLPFRRVLNW